MHIHHRDVMLVPRCCVTDRRPGDRCFAQVVCDRPSESAGDRGDGRRPGQDARPTDGPQDDAGRAQLDLHGNHRHHRLEHAAARSVAGRTACTARSGRPGRQRTGGWDGVYRPQWPAGAAEGGTACTARSGRPGQQRMGQGVLCSVSGRIGGGGRAWWTPWSIESFDYLGQLIALEPHKKLNGRLH